MKANYRDHTVSRYIITYVEVNLDAEPTEFAVVERVVDTGMADIGQLETGKDFTKTTSQGTLQFCFRETTSMTAATMKKLLRVAFDLWSISKPMCVKVHEGGIVIAKGTHLNDDKSPNNDGQYRT